MKRALTIAPIAVLIATAAFGRARAPVTSHRPAATVVAAATTVVAAAAGEHAGHVMTAADHVAHMAAAGNIHAAHAIDEAKWAPRQAAPASALLPPDDMGAAARLASSPRKGEYVKIDVGGTPMNTWVVRPSG